MRPCPIPDLCVGGSGGGNSLCLGDNIGPYCLVCPSSHFASTTGVCLECGSYGGVTTVQVVGILLAVCLLLGAVTFVGAPDVKTSSVGNDTDRKESLLTRTTGLAPHKTTRERLRDKLVELGQLVGCVRCDLPDTLPRQVVAQIEDLLVTVEMFLLKLTWLLPRVPPQEPGLRMEKALSNAELLCPVIDQLASTLAGLPGAATGEVATVVLSIR